MIIGITGYAGVGKDTLADLLVEHQGFEKRSFAEPLKAFYLLIGRERDLAHIELVGMDKAKRVLPSIREDLQKIGTAAREVFGENFWIDLSMPKADANVVFADVRYPNEADAIRKAGGKIIRLKRSKIKPVNQHSSELMLDTIEPDLTIEDMGIMASLSEVEEFLCLETRL